MKQLVHGGGRRKGGNAGLAWGEKGGILNKQDEMRRFSPREEG